MKTNTDRRWIGIALIFGAMFMVLIAFFSNRKSLVSKSDWIGHKPQVKVEHEARLEFYREQLARKLNRDRVEAELLNQGEAPQLSRGDAGARTQDQVLKGIPLEQDRSSHIYSFGRRSSPYLDIDSPDQRIQHGLLEEQDRKVWQNSVDQSALNEFLANARSQGYDVILDSDLNVVDIKRIPVSNSIERQRAPAADPKSPEFVD